MFHRTLHLYKNTSACLNCYIVASSRSLCSQELDIAYTDDQKQKILEVMNLSNDKDLARYDVTKTRVRKIAEWKGTYGQLKSIADIGLIDGFADKYAKKLYDSILKGPLEKVETKKVKNKIRGQVLQPPLSEAVRQKCKLILSVYVTVNSVCWALVDRGNYELTEWTYYGIDYPDGKKLQITDIMLIAWKVTRCLPPADLYVMKAEPTTLRASGSDPNNPKVLSVNLQKLQMIAMIVALINARSNQFNDLTEDSSNLGNLRGEVKEDILKNKVYFLRPTLPYRLYGTLVGNERVSTDQTVDLLLQKMAQKTEREKYDPYISEQLKSEFKSQNELQRDMLGHCLLLALTFMDICIYKKQQSIDKLVKRGE